MKLSSETLAVLQNYTNINPSILIQAGQVLRTIDAGKTIISSAQIKEDFPIDFAIYDLPNFLQVVKMFEGAELDFGDDSDGYCQIRYTGSDNVVRFMYASPEAVDAAKKDIVMPETEINFTLTADNLAKLTKAATTMGLNHVLIAPSDENKITITVCDTDNPTSNTFKIEVDADLDMSEFEVVIDFSKFATIMPNDYNVGISSKEISHFYNDRIQYWVALNTNSSFQG